jgi:hypothetical protein
MFIPIESFKYEVVRIIEIASSSNRECYKPADSYIVWVYT